jgi:undecaprenyl-diphosphatase
VNLVVAFLPSALIGPVFERKLDALLFRPLPVLLALAGGGAFMIALDRVRARGGLASERAVDQLDWRHALLIGALQCLALWPGTSRSMTTIVGGLLVGLRPREAAEFSFLLGCPRWARRACGSCSATATRSRSWGRARC